MRTLFYVLYLATVALVSAIGLAGCSDFTAPTDALRIPITDAMRTDWAYLEDCYHLHGDIETVKFYIVERPGTEMTLDGQTGEGFYNRSTRSIFVMRDGAEPSLWRHEMLHALLDPITGHPAKYFTYGCF